MEKIYCGIIKTELITPEILKMIAMTPEPEFRSVDQLRKSTNGYSLIFSREPIVGVLIVNPDIELNKIEWNNDSELEKINIDKNWYDYLNPLNWSIFN